MKELLIIVLRKINSITKTKVVFSFTQDLDLKGEKKMDQRDGSVDEVLAAPAGRPEGFPRTCIK